MPWTVITRGDKFCVYKEDDNGRLLQSLGCHDTKEAAREQQKALYASEADGVQAAAYGTPSPATVVESPPQEAPPPAGEGPSAEPIAAGVALVARDTGRVLLLQRALVDGSESGGLWEFPGGHLENDEVPYAGAYREFCEECGHEMPAGRTVGTWLSPNGVYRGFIHVISAEDDFPIGMTDASNRTIENPDNPGGENYTEAMAWFDPAHLKNGPKLLRPEMREYIPWRMIAEAGGNLSAAAIGLPDESLSRYAAEGLALPDGTFPIPDCSYVRRAVQLYAGVPEEGRATVRCHIMRRARALGCDELIPGEWITMTTCYEDFESLVASLSAPASALLPEHDLPGPTPWTIADDGLTADGHLALWASCHIGYPGCVKPPREDSFDFFNLGDAVTADGRHVPVGKVTIGTGHAGPDLSWRTASAHYDESGTAAAVGHAMADKWGIRLPSVIVAGLAPERVDEARRSPLSGDWRRINGRLRLVAALGVNVPGYPVPRALVAAGEVQSMFVGFDPADAAELVVQADELAAELGFDFTSRADRLFNSLK